MDDIWNISPLIDLSLSILSQLYFRMHTVLLLKNIQGEYLSSFYTPFPIVLCARVISIEGILNTFFCIHSIKFMYILQEEINGEVFWIYLFIESKNSLFVFVSEIFSIRNSIASIEFNG